MQLCLDACCCFCRACSTKMTKRPTDHLEPAPKKRSGDRQISREEPPSDDDEEQVCKAHNSLGMHLSVACLDVCPEQPHRRDCPHQHCFCLLTMKGVLTLCEAGPGLLQLSALGGGLQGRHPCRNRMLETSALNLYELQVLCFTRYIGDTSAPS